MNQERIFRFIGSAGLEGGFAAGSVLPKEKGNMRSFKIIRISALKDENSDELASRLIIKLGEKPKSGGEFRARQLKSLIEKYTDQGKMFIIVIGKAHLLDQKTLYSLKSIHEWGSDEGTHPGFILLGDIVKIQSLLNKEKGLLLRTIILPR